MDKKIKLDESIVKYIFPGTSPEVALGEDGYIIYDFKKLYPDKLGIFVPIEVEKSNYSSAFPKSFEDYFIDAGTEMRYLSRFLEADIKFILGDVHLEYIPGSVLKRDIANNYTIFRFDKLMGGAPRTDLLCRVRKGFLSFGENLDILNSNFYFLEDAANENGKVYRYFIIPINQLLMSDEDRNILISAVFSYARAFKENIAP